MTTIARISMAEIEAAILGKASAPDLDCLTTPKLVAYLASRRDLSEREQIMLDRIARLQRTLDAMPA